MSETSRKTTLLTETAEKSREMHNNKRPRVEMRNTFIEQITLAPDIQTGLVNNKKFEDVYDKFQMAYIPHANKACSTMRKNHIEIKELSNVFADLDEDDQETWTEETWDSSAKQSDKGLLGNARGSFLSDDSIDKIQRGYCSFIVQHSEQILGNLLGRLPISELPLAAEIENECTSTSDNGTKSGKHELRKLDHGPGLWIFFGRNSKPSDDLQGRGEHTDSIDHHGTFHYQWSGIKDWHFRPTQDLIQRMSKGDYCAHPVIEKWSHIYEGIEKDDTPKDRIDIRCEEGDILLVNTKLWWHATTLPAQPESKTCSNMSVPSVSYARDIYLERAKNGSKDRGGSKMTNLDGLYAANDIPTGTIVFRENDMPDCELHRTANDPNCEIVELEGGEGAIVACRDIRSGEFFCVLESEDEDSGDEIDFDYEEEEDDE